MTPVPTLAISGVVASMFTGANSWMGSLGEVFSIGAAISIALAILGLIAYLIVSALQQARKGFK
jgi:hypothetical protein